MKKLVLLMSVLLGVGSSLVSQNVNRVKKPEMLRNQGRKEIRLPQVEGYEILKCDFHIHTVFSDGNVWPTVRVKEAWHEGLDAIAITDHIEYRPHKKYLTKDFNSSYEIAKPEAERLNILLVRGGEITRKMPPGHMNALFLSDVNKIDQSNFMKAMEEANKQGAFVIWNHPGWKAQQPDTTKWWPVHDELYEKDWLHGIEVFGYDDYCPIASEWCMQKQLSYIGCTDVHNSTGYAFDLSRYYRPMTLVFAKERSMEGLRQAMFDRRSVAFFGDELAGPEALLRHLFEASVVVKAPFRVHKGKIYFEISNPTDLMIRLENKVAGLNAPDVIDLMPGNTVIVSCDDKKGVIELPYEVSNWHIGMQQNLEVQIEVLNNID
ncbi:MULTISPECIES: Sb-PDE family phosphodiesterase [unclassified Carboxylicivirga]|uniref:Sb-PDE family phosphodiesterase n=1 Tax=Carboxylicivirga TaxID=1628153 RepID=UPI003D33B08A